MLDSLVGFFREAWNTITGLITALISTIENLLAGVSNPFEPLVAWFSEIAGKILDLVTGLAKKIGTKIADAVKSVGSGIVDFVTGGPDEPAPGEGPSVMDSYVPPKAAVPAGMLAAPPASSNQTTINQTINGAGDPRAVGQESVNRMGLGGSLQRVQPGLYGPTVG
jgi:phage-related protein